MSHRISSKIPGASPASKLIWSIKLLPYRITGRRRIALASFPRSGNSWIRNLIEKSTNLKTGTVTDDGIMPGSSDGVVLKTHFWDSHKYTDGIHIVRNPYDSIHSYYLWKQSYLNYNRGWEASLKEDLKGWHDHTLHWLNSVHPCKTVKYEDLHENTPKYLGDILKWLEIDVTQEVILKACRSSEISNLKKENPEHANNHYREGKIGYGFQHFSDDEKALVKEVVGDLMLEFGYKLVLN